MLAWTLIGITATLTRLGWTRVQGARRGPVRSLAAVHAEEVSAPVAFIENLGQWRGPARFRAQVGMSSTWLEPDGFLLQGEAAADAATSRGGVARMRFVGADPATRLRGERRLAGVHHYFLGNDPSRWRTRVPRFGSVRYEGLYPGVDLRVRPGGVGIEYDLLLEASADLQCVRVVCEGTGRLELRPDGSLAMVTALGPIVQHAPVAWHVGSDGGRLAADCRFVLHGEDSFGFELVTKARALPLVVDPGIEWATFVGGADTEDVQGIALDPASGEPTIAGSTWSPDYPITPGAYQVMYHKNFDGFVTRLDPTGRSLRWSTFLGGWTNDELRAVAVGRDGSCAVVGRTASNDYPTTPGAFDRRFRSGPGLLIPDGFVTRLSADGSALVFSTYLASGGPDDLKAVGITAQGDTVVAGWTGAPDFPTTPGAYDRVFAGKLGRPVIVTRFNATGSGLVFSTFLGGPNGQDPQAMAVDADGSATVTGQCGDLFPTTPGALRGRVIGPSSDAFVTRFTPDGSGLVFSTLVGGSATDCGTALATAADGTTYLAGWTWSPDLPTTPGAFDRTWHGNQFVPHDGFVLALAPGGGALRWCSFLAGVSQEEIRGLVVDSAGAVTVTGWTYSADFPTTPGALRVSPIAGTMTFVTQFHPTGSRLNYSSFLNGATGASARGIARDPSGSVVVTGSAAPDFPTTPRAFQTVSAGLHEAFVARLDLLPAGVTRFGRSTPGCQGAQAMAVTRMPRAGDAAFALTCTDAPPGTGGLLLLGAGHVTGLPIAGIWLHVDPAQFFVPLLVVSSATGAAEVALPLPPGSQGAQLAAQFVWANAPPCGALGTLSSSNALALVVQ